MKNTIILTVCLIPLILVISKLSLRLYFDYNYIPVEATITSVDTLASDPYADGARGIELEYTYTTKQGKNYTVKKMYPSRSFKIIPVKGQVMQAGYMPIFNSYCRILDNYDLQKNK